MKLYGVIHRPGLNPNKSAYSNYSRSFLFAYCNTQQRFVNVDSPTIPDGDTLEARAGGTLMREAAKAAKFIDETDHDVMFIFEFAGIHFAQPKLLGVLDQFRRVRVGYHYEIIPEPGALIYVHTHTDFITKNVAPMIKWTALTSFICGGLSLTALPTALLLALTAAAPFSKEMTDYFLGAPVTLGGAIGEHDDCRGALRQMHSPPFEAPRVAAIMMLVGAALIHHSAGWIKITALCLLAAPLAYGVEITRENKKLILKSTSQRLAVVPLSNEVDPRDVAAVGGDLGNAGEIVTARLRRTPPHLIASPLRLQRTQTLVQRDADPANAQVARRLDFADAAVEQRPGCLTRLRAYLWPSINANDRETHERILARAEAQGLRAPGR